MKDFNAKHREDSDVTTRSPSYPPLEEALISDDAFEQPGEEATLGAEEELWLADPATGRLAGGAQSILSEESTVNSPANS